MRTSPPGIASVLLTLLCLSLPAAQAKITLKSSWPESELTVDGSLDDWGEAMTYLSRSKLFVGLRNDAQYLYVGLHSRDPETGIQILARGLVLDVSRKGKESLKLVFPPGIDRTGTDRPAAGPQDREKLLEALKESLGSFRLLGSGPEQTRMIPVDNDLGIEIRARTENGEFSYELKLPMQVTEDRPYAVGAGLEDEIVLRLETPESDRDAVHERMRERDDLGGARRGGTGLGTGDRSGRGAIGGGMGRGAMGDGIGRGPGGPGGTMTVPLRIKANVVLAVEP